LGFVDVTSLLPLGPGRFQADVHPDWTIAGKPNGGYLLAILGRAATSNGPHPHVIAAGAHYLASPDPGPVVVEADVLRAGRRVSQVRARMSQQGRPCVESLITTSTIDSSATSHWDGGVPDPAIVPNRQCRPLVPVLPDGSRVGILEQIEVRLDPGYDGFTRNQPSGRGELRGWLALPSGEDFDPASLLFAVDAFPPATFDLEFSGWVPTFELTVYVRALPSAGPVRVVQRAGMIADSRVDEACFVWDSAGRLVAHGIQLAGIRLG
jgi:hypothetical protein